MLRRFKFMAGVGYKVCRGCGASLLMLRPSIMSPQQRYTCLSCRTLITSRIKAIKTPKPVLSNE